MDACVPEKGIFTNATVWGWCRTDRGMDGMPHAREYEDRKARSNVTRPLWRYLPNGDRKVDIDAPMVTRALANDAIHNYVSSMRWANDASALVFDSSSSAFLIIRPQRTMDASPIAHSVKSTSSTYRNEFSRTSHTIAATKNKGKIAWQRGKLQGREKVQKTWDHAFKF